jgi:hypothetical protein
LDALSILKEIAGKVAPGRPPAYTEAHALMGLEAIESGLGIGRQQLSRELGLGEGTMRTLVGRMKTLGLVETSRGGMSLTGEGEAVLEALGNLFWGCSLPPLSITVGPFNYAVLIHGTASKVRCGIEQRDAAIIAGASGATTLVLDELGLRMPGMMEPLEESVRNLILEELSPSPGDAIIIGSSDDLFFAEMAAKSAALVLLAG